MRKIVEEINGIGFVYDGCHKIYVCEDSKDFENAKQYGYDELYDMKDLYEAFINSCPLRFISNWKLTTKFIEQCEYSEEEIDKEILKENEEE